MSLLTPLEHCIRECSWNDTHCEGCFLTRKQLKFWLNMSDEEKQSALADARKRKEKYKLPSSNG